MNKIRAPRDSAGAGELAAPPMSSVAVTAREGEVFRTIETPGSPASATQHKDPSSNGPFGLSNRLHILIYQS